MGEIRHERFPCLVDGIERIRGHARSLDLGQVAPPQMKQNEIVINTGGNHGNR